MASLPQAGIPVAVAPSPDKFSPGGLQANPGQAAYNEQDNFNDPTGKYKLVMKGMAVPTCLCWACGNGPVQDATAAGDAANNLPFLPFSV